MDILSFNQWAVENNIDVDQKNFRNSNLRMTYNLKKRPDLAPVQYIRIIAERYDMNNLEAPYGCVVFFLNDRSTKWNDIFYEIPFYMENLKEAYELLFAYCFLPERIRYEIVKDKKYETVSRENYFNAALKKSPPDAIRYRDGIYALLLFFPSILYGLIGPAIDTFFRRWEYVFESEGENFVISKRYCFGFRRGRTSRKTWMVWEYF